MQTSKYDEEVRILKKWYSKQPHLPQNIGNEYFYNFVSGTNSLEKAKEKIDSYFTLRKEMMESLYDVRMGSRKFINHCQSLDIGILPDTTPEGYRVMFLVGRKEESDKFNMDAYLLLSVLMVEMGLSIWPEDSSYLVIEDGEGSDATRFRTMDIRNITSYAKFLHKGMPVKMKKFCMINSPSFTDKVISFFNILVPKKMNGRVSFHQGDSKLKDILPINMIPAEYGGQGKSLKEMDVFWKKELESRGKWFEERLKLVCDESKRPITNPIDHTLDFGVDGTYTALGFD